MRPAVPRRGSAGHGGRSAFRSSCVTHDTDAVCQVTFGRPMTSPCSRPAPSSPTARQRRGDSVSRSPRAARSCRARARAWLASGSAVTHPDLAPTVRGRNQRALAARSDRTQFCRDVPDRRSGRSSSWRRADCETGWLVSPSHSCGFPGLPAWTVGTRQQPAWAVARAR